MFKVGDTVKLKNYDKYRDYREHRGEIATIESAIYDDMFDYGIDWVDGEHSSVKKNNLILLWEAGNKPKEVKMDKAKFGIKYDRDEDPVEFFETTKEAEKRIKELLGEDDVDKESIYLFEVGNKWRVDQPVKYDLIEVK